MGRGGGVVLLGKVPGGGGGVDLQAAATVTGVGKQGRPGFVAPDGVGVE